MLENYLIASLWLALALISTIIAYWLKISIALIEISVGIIAAFLLTTFFPNIQTGADSNWLKFLAGSGAILLTFLSGTELDSQSIKKKKNEIFIIGFIGFFAPFIGCSLIAKYLLYWDLRASLLAGVALSTTSMAVVYSVMLEYGFNKNIIKNAYSFYNKMTTHGSSLSRAQYAIVAAKIGKIKNAYTDFLRAAELDLKDLKNKVGIHAASLGGVYNILIQGFAGLNILKEGLEVNPQLPFKWKEMKFKIYYKDFLFKFDCNKNKIVIQSDKKAQIKIIIKNKEYILNKKLEVKF